MEIKIFVISLWLHDQRVKWLKGGSFSRYDSNVPSLASMDFLQWRYNDLVCHETLHNHFIEGSCKYMGGELFAVSRNPDTSCDHMHCFWFVAWPHVSTCLKGYVNLWVKPLASYHLPYYVWWSLVKRKWKYFMSCDITNTSLMDPVTLWEGTFHGK